MEFVQRSRSQRFVSIFSGKIEIDMVLLIGVLGFDRSTESRLQICPVTSACCASMHQTI